MASPLLQLPSNSSSPALAVVGRAEPRLWTRPLRELTDETLEKIAQELAENLRKNLTVDWSARESVQAKLRLMVKRILRKYKYPPDQQDAAVELVLLQARALAEAWA